MPTPLDADLAYTPAWRLARLIRRGRLSPVELTTFFLDRIEGGNPQLNAYLTVDREGALRQAQAAETTLAKGGHLPPLLGVPVSIKDLIFTAGLRTTSGSLVYRNHVPDQDAVVVERLRRAGAVILGKTNTSEFGLSATAENLLGDDGRNPWDVTRTSGGSSGGAAASVAAGLGPLAIGSDGGGSIRIPASFCGVYGFKPTYGTVPSHGGFSSMPAFSHQGPITRNIRDAAEVLNVVAGHDPRDSNARRTRPRSFTRGLRRGVRGLRVAWSSDLSYAWSDPEVLELTAAAARTFEALGCVVEEATPEIGEPFSGFGPIVGADAFASLGRLLETDGDSLTQYARRTLERGREVTGAEYSRALRSVEKIRSTMAGFFDDYDLLLSPATAVPACPCNERPSVVAGQPVGSLWGPFPFSVPFNLTGQPAASIPCGFTKGGLPVGLQVAGRLGEDVTVLRASAAFEEARPWAQHRPGPDMQPR
jgi:Asp-tRNA(Asn)/Glu-tRNA(Gln) amidotransferase A subunit family amidase